MHVICGHIKPARITWAGLVLVSGTKEALDRVLHTSGLIVRYNSSNYQLLQLLYTEVVLAFSLRYRSAIFSKVGWPIIRLIVRWGEISMILSDKNLLILFFCLSLISTNTYKES